MQCDVRTDVNGVFSCNSGQMLIFLKTAKAFVLIWKKMHVIEAYPLSQYVN